MVFTVAKGGQNSVYCFQVKIFQWIAEIPVDAKAK